MTFKKLKNYIVLLITITFIMPQTLLAYSSKIIAGGESIGIEIKNKGIIVAGFYKVGNKYPGVLANLQKGDTIINVNNTSVNSIDNFIEMIKNDDDKILDITYKRNNKKYETNLELIEDDNTIKTGLYVKDTVSGIGTLSFIDPKTKLYGALGHEVNESTSGVKLDVKEGSIYTSSVNNIEKSLRGEPGSKKATTDFNNSVGNITENTISGIFGTYTNEFNKDKLYNVASYKDIKLSNAKIITVLNGTKKQEYDIKILSVNNDKKDNKNILFEITDNELIKKTGGIVQGMSGSPITQNDNIIGAVTNVVVNDPKKGYAILITTMLEEAEN